MLIRLWCDLSRGSEVRLKTGSDMSRVLVLELHLDCWYFDVISYELDLNCFLECMSFANLKSFNESEVISEYRGITWKSECVLVFSPSSVT